MTPIPMLTPEYIHSLPAPNAPLHPLTAPNPPDGPLTPLHPLRVP